MGTPIASVVIPCHDHGAFLPETVESVERQTLRDFELLVVDDGSSDAGTLAVLDSLRARGVRVLALQHGGVTRARNAGLRAARGRYITFLDADDRFAPEFLELTVAALDGDPRLGFATTWVRVFGDENWDWRPESCAFPWLLHDCSVYPSALLRRQAVLDVGGFDETLELGHEDWNLWISVVERGFVGTIIERVLFHYRRAGPSRSSVIDHGATYLELYRDLLVRHPVAYRQHLFEVLWLKESNTAPRLAYLPELQQRVEGSLTESVDRARTRLVRALEARER